LQVCVGAGTGLAGREREVLGELAGGTSSAASRSGEALGQSPSTIRRQLRYGELPGYRRGTGTKAHWVEAQSPASVSP
jgi:hypothetical protein